MSWRQSCWAETAEECWSHPPTETEKDCHTLSPEETKTQVTTVITHYRVPQGSGLSPVFFFFLPLTLFILSMTKINVKKLTCKTGHLNDSFLLILSVKSD